MRSSNAFEVFEKRWQLPVYFQLRWKEIIGTFEASLVSTPRSAEWALPQSAAAWKAVQSCWAPDIFLPELGHRFWRTTLQVSRFDNWDIADSRLYRDMDYGFINLQNRL